MGFRVVLPHCSWLASFPGPSACSCVHVPGMFSHMHNVYDRRVNFCVGEDSCNSQTPKKGSKSTLLLAILWSACRAEPVSSAKGREVQLSFDWSLPTDD